MALTWGQKGVNIIVNGLTQLPTQWFQALSNDGRENSIEANHDILGTPDNGSRHPITGNLTLTNGQSALSPGNPSITPMVLCRHTAPKRTATSWEPLIMDPVIL
jgi:hypothetical protein